jgi:hypothetical protein
MSKKSNRLSAELVQAFAETHYTVQDQCVGPGPGYGSGQIVGQTLQAERLCLGCGRWLAYPGPTLVTQFSVSSNTSSGQYLPLKSADRPPQAGEKEL